MTDSGLDFSFAIGILDPARQSHYAVVSENITEQRVDQGIVEVRNRYSFF
jgi:hypothetical protein